MTTQIPLTQGLVTVVDLDDCDRVTAAGKWYAQRDGNKFYARRSVGSRNTKQFLHTFLTGWPLVDHINGNSLDNRRANLRPATKAENTRNRGPVANNTSGFKGVSWDRAASRWRAQIRDGTGRKIHLGRFAIPEEAARTYDDAARELHGEFAWLNFPKEA